MAKKLSRRQWRKKCDDLRGKIVHSVGYCEWCGRADRQLQDHHLIRRDNFFFRHNLENAVCLCASCHTLSKDHSTDATPWLFEDWFHDNHRARWEWWVKNRVNIPIEKVDYEQIYDVLREEAKKRGIT